MNTIVEVEKEGRFLSVYRGFLKISYKKVEEARIPLDDISVLMISAQGLSLTKEVLTRINDRGGMVVLCGRNYSPSSFVLPLSSHYEFTGRITDQIETTQPLRKQIWKSVIQHKIRNQAHVLSLLKCEGYSHLRNLAERVMSGDKENQEAQAARFYWKNLFQGPFKRDPNEPGINSILNYGYGILRSMTARAVVSAGLLPALGIHHCNRNNNLCLVDDLMEPYRPLFDLAAVKLSHDEDLVLTPEKKQFISRLAWLDLETSRGRTPLIKALEYYAYSLVDCFKLKCNQLIIPPIPEEECLYEALELCI